ncbi:MAG: alternative oxidase [Kiritimatiellae bacterium]|nr:alternative oxidase [Kiritimatiellia bacterium]
MTDDIYTMGKELDLKAEQEKTLATPRLPANLTLKIMFLTFDLLYGKGRSLPKVLVLEILARYPYWAWENGAYKLLSLWHCATGPVDQQKIKDALRHIEMGREAQDNEQWHMLLWADLCRQQQIKLSWFKHWLLPRHMTFVYFYLTRIMYWIKPVWSFRMNAAFESHAEHEYMLFAQEHPEFDSMAVDSIWFEYYPRQKSLGDLIRRVGLDERDHMNRSLAEAARLEGGGNS